MKMKTDVENIVRDINSGALLNTDKKSLQAYKIKKRKNAEIDMLKDEVNSIKNDISEVKSILFKIAEKL